MKITLKWDEVGTRLFETGVDRVVLYPTDGVGVPWNGVTSITEKVEGYTSTPLYLDGIKYQEARVYGDFAATIEAFSAPDEFSSHSGTSFNLQGLGFGLQPTKPFSFSYRTIVGNDVEREDYGYKIHLVYRAYATQAEQSYTTMGESVDPTVLSWDISTLPKQIYGRRPTAHLILDSRLVPLYHLRTIEGWLYGTEGVIPHMPEPSELISLLLTELIYPATTLFPSPDLYTIGA